MLYTEENQKKIADELTCAIVVLDTIRQIENRAQSEIYQLRCKSQSFITKLLTEVLEYINKYFPEGKDVGPYLDTDWNRRITDKVEESLDHNWLKFFDTFDYEYIFPKELFLTNDKKTKKEILSKFLKSWRLYSLPLELQNSQRLVNIYSNDLYNINKKMDKIKKQLEKIQKSNPVIIDFNSIKFPKREEEE